MRRGCFWRLVSGAVMALVTTSCLTTCDEDPCFPAFTRGERINVTLTNPSGSDAGSPCRNAGFDYETQFVMVLSEPVDLSCVGYKVDLEVPGYSLVRTNRIPNDQRLIGGDFDAVRGDCTSLLRLNVSVLGNGSLPHHADASAPATARISITLSEGPGSCAAMNCDDVFIVDLDPAPPHDASSAEQ